MSTDNQETQATEAKTFTQEELDSILKERLQREHAKYADYEDLKGKAAKFDELEEQNKSELQKATEKANELQKALDAMKAEKQVGEIRARVAKDTGVPVELLTASTEEECEAQAKAISEFAKPSAYPNVPDGGEVRGGNKQTTRDQFAKWFSENTQ